MISNDRFALRFWVTGTGSDDGPDEETQLSIQTSFCLVLELQLVDHQTGPSLVLEKNLCLSVTNGSGVTVTRLLRGGGPAEPDRPLDHNMRHQLWM